MIYRLLRWFTGIALHWFYSSIQVIGRDRIPTTGPVILAASHHNALVDALIAGWIAPRRLTLTAKATLMDNAFLAWLFPLVGVVPLRRAKDETGRNGGSTPSVERNASAFVHILDVLERGGMILIFPEGISHSNPELAPLKTGASRLALEARDKRTIRNLQIIPLGLSFEDKGNPGTAVLAEVGQAIPMDAIGEINVDTLTALIAERLAVVSLKKPNPSPDRYIINYARDLALKRSKTPDEPAMLTIIYSLLLILGSYAVQFALVAALFNPWWAALYVSTLPLGAYWAAFGGHPSATSYRAS
jgi:1-acyl-sn-glycerol-3-phosphate acyltransferase